jgi:hypothetical protein
MLELAHKIQSLWDRAGKREIDAEIDHADSARLAELVLALDGWLSMPPEGKDGFLPSKWQSPMGSPGMADAVRRVLIDFRDRCIGRGNPGFFDPDGAVILSHAIRWLSYKAENKSYEPLTD